MVPYARSTLLGINEKTLEAGLTSESSASGWSKSNPLCIFL